MPEPDPRDAKAVLRERYGYTEFRGDQEDIIRHVVGGGDALVLMPTGGGKSLCYQIPSILRNGVGVVVSPLIALMQDQVGAMRQIGVRATFLNSSLEPHESRAIEHALVGGDYDLLYKKIAVQGRIKKEKTNELIQKK